jgi:hypothetical protein
MPRPAVFVVVVLDYRGDGEERREVAVSDSRRRNANPGRRNGWLLACCGGAGGLRMVRLLSGQAMIGKVRKAEFPVHGGACE